MVFQLHNREPLLSPRFIAEQDLADVNSSLTGSDLSSPADSKQGFSAETGEEDENDDYIAELTRRMAHYMLQDEDNHENRWALSGSPQSTLCSPLGSDQESPTGLSREPSPPAGPVIENFDKMKKMNEERALNKPNSIPITFGIQNPSFHSKQTLLHNQIRASQFYRLKREQADFGPLKNGPRVAINNLHALQEKQSIQQSAGSDTKAVFLNASGSRNNSCGTGVFLPRAIGTSQEQRNKQGCSTVLIPARVVQALKLHFEKMGVPSRFNICGLPLQDAFGSGRNSVGMYSGQKEQTRTAPAIQDHELSLPCEWTY